jgi:hypothetical protein
MVVSPVVVDVQSLGQIGQAPVETVLVEEVNASNVVDVVQVVEGVEYERLFDWQVVD